VLKSKYPIQIQNGYTPIQRICRTFQITQQLYSQVVRRQFPIQFAAGRTIHRISVLFFGPLGQVLAHKQSKNPVLGPTRWPRYKSSTRFWGQLAGPGTILRAFWGPIAGPGTLFDWTPVANSWPPCKSLMSFGGQQLDSKFAASQGCSVESHST